MRESVRESSPHFIVHSRKTPANRKFQFPPFFPKFESSNPYFLQPKFHSQSLSLSLSLSISLPISMANSEVPSFSLGLDTPPHSPINPLPSPAARVSDSDPDTRPDPPRPLLKRLRRGPPPPSLDVDDDIEEFSSEEDPDQGKVS